MCYKRVICLVFMATVLFVGSFGSPSADLENAPNSSEIVRRFEGQCPYDTHVGESWCKSSRVVERQCINDDDNSLWGHKPEICRYHYKCVGSRRRDPSPRAARCVPPLQRLYKWVSDKAKGASIMQCATFNPGGQPGGGAQAVGIGAILGITDITKPITMPSTAELFYDQASNPISILSQSDMDSESGTFAFEAPIDLSQTLDLCLFVPGQVSLTFGVIETDGSGTNLEDLSYNTDIVLHDRIFDGKAWVWDKNSTRILSGRKI